MQPMFRSSCALFLVLTAGSVAAVPRQTPPLPERPADRPSVRKAGDSTYEIGPPRVDTAKREVVVPASINGVQILEFVANAKGGSKAHESALTLDTDAITFNTALLLIGLDPSRGRPPKAVFDQGPAAGDPIDMFVSWGTRTVRIEELLYDQRTKKTLPAGKWVYTGSTFVDAGNGRTVSCGTRRCPDRIHTQSVGDHRTGGYHGRIWGGRDQSRARPRGWSRSHPDDSGPASRSAVRPRWS